MTKAVVLVVGVVAAFVLLIVLIGGGEDDPSGGGVGDAAAIYRTRCASCHGVDGGGGNGPQLSGGRAVERYPDVADQVELVTAGRLSQGMPAFGKVLSAEEIEAVVEYTRSL